MREEEIHVDPRGFSEVSTTSLEETPLASRTGLNAQSPGAGRSSFSPAPNSLALRNPISQTEPGNRSFSQNLGYQS